MRKLLYSILMFVLFSCSSKSTPEPKEELTSDYKSEFKIPVVIHLTDVKNNFMSDKQVDKFIHAINLNFNALNESLKMVSSHFANIVGNPSIEFVLAKKGPDGGATNGINRIITEKANISASKETEDYIELVEFIKSEVGNWNGNEYLNLIFCDLPTGEGIVLTSSSLMDEWGYKAMPPYDKYELAGREFDKKSMLTGLFIDSDILKAFNKSVIVTTHEIGHWFGIRHTFGAALNPFGDEYASVVENQINQGNKGLYETFEDRIDDTPWTCVQTDNVDFEQFGKVVNAENFMGYTENLERKMFTKGQVEVMHKTLNNTKGRRSNLCSEINLKNKGIY